LDIKPNNEWIAISTKDGNFLRPEIKTHDTTFFLGDSAGEIQKKLMLNEYELIKQGKAFYIKPLKGIHFLGKVSSEGLENTFLFNGLVSGGKEIGSNNYKKIRFTRNNGSNIWKVRGKYFEDCPLRIEVGDQSNETYYQIENELTGIVEYISLDESDDVIHRDFRKLHLFEYQNAFYLIRISEADLKNDSNYINFIFVKLQPELDLQE